MRVVQEVAEVSLDLIKLTLTMSMVFLSVVTGLAVGLLAVQVQKRELLTKLLALLLAVFLLVACLGLEFGLAKVLEVAFS